MSENEVIDVTQLSDISGLPGTLAQRVYRALREAILNLHFPPGAVLRKAPICTQLGVSRSPVAEAITRLASEGLVDVVPQSATRVSCFSMEEIREGAFLREALELAAVTRVVETRTTQQLTELKRNLALQQLLINDNDFAGFYEADENFHGLIMQFTGYSKLANIAINASLHVDRARRLLLPSPDRISDSFDEHQSIVAAIEARSESAARDAMQHHLSELVTRIEPLVVEQPNLFGHS